MSKLKLKSMLDQTDDKEKRKFIHTALHKYNKLLTTMLVLNNFINILASSLATLIVLSLLPNSGSGVAAAISTGFMTFLILIFGEITPKIYSSQQAEKMFHRSITIVSAASYILGPLIYVLVSISNFLIRIGGGITVQEPPFITENDIVSVMNVGAKEGAIELEERKMLTGALEMKETAVREIMVPRVDMVVLDENKNLQEAVKTIQEEGFSRYPVFRENIDTIVGVVYAKDILKALHERGLDVLSKTKVKEIMHPPFFIPETKKIDALLQEFKTNMVHLAIIVDEYGGTEGLVTIEDIIEQVMGEIMDEFDEGENTGLKKVSDKEYIVDSKVPINDIERELDIDFPETDFETLGGYLLERFERVPRVGDEIKVNGFHFKILAASRSKIEKIRFTILSDEIHPGKQKEAK
jgi:CBS domain containing-hemolysin-like protein